MRHCTKGNRAGSDGKRTASKVYSDRCEALKEKIDPKPTASASSAWCYVVLGISLIIREYLCYSIYLIMRRFFIWGRSLEPLLEYILTLGGNSCYIISAAVLKMFHTKC